MEFVEIQKVYKSLKILNKAIKKTIKTNKNITNCVSKVKIKIIGAEKTVQKGRKNENPKI